MPIHLLKLVLLLPITGFSAAFGDEKAGEVGAGATEMPRRFASIHFDVTKDELRAMRKVSPVMTLKTNSPNVWVEPNLGGPYFQSALYGFDERSATLAWVAFVGELPAKDADGYRKRLVADAITKWGRDYSVYRSSRQIRSQSEECITIVWKRPGAKVFLSLAANPTASTQMIDLKLVKPQIEQSDAIPDLGAPDFRVRDELHRLLNDAKIAENIPKFE